MIRSLFQPIETVFRPTGEKPNSLTMEECIELLRREEDYWPGEQNNTKLTISRLRKIYYDQWGWNRELIRGAAHIQPRYETSLLVRDRYEVPIFGVDIPFVPDEFEVIHYTRLVAYRSDDREYPDRAGRMTEVYADNNQEATLPDGTVCDVAHILSGIDAMNYPDDVSPLPEELEAFGEFLPHVDKNYDATTWLGDIASASAESFFEWALEGRRLGLDGHQKIIDEYASGPDMLGNIDGYVFREAYDIGASDGRRFTDMLADYYLDKPLPGESKPSGKRNRRYSIFCDAVGLRGWNGKTFTEAADWVKYYSPQMRDAILFYMMTRTKGLEKFILGAVTETGLLERVIVPDFYLWLFVEALARCRRKEDGNV